MSSDSSSSDDIPARLSNKEAIRRCNEKISAIDSESNKLMEEINALEKKYELIRSKKDLHAKKLQESGFSSSFFGFVILIIVAIVILLK